ncbi:MAG: hypothetical protein GY832_02450 [Chloroflexi bacterium]|nr:hypothetical protein [Chloroflexota bacterium]
MITGILENFRSWVGQVEAMATDALAALGPWLAPIPSAALVARASQEHLHWSTGLGLVAGAIIEILGLTATSTALALWDYNESKRKSDPPAPFPLAVALVGFYYASTVGLTVFLDITPNLARFAPVIFPTLALVGTVNLALRAQHKRRTGAIAQEKVERRTRRTAQQVHKNDAQQVHKSNDRNAQGSAQNSPLDAVNRTRQERKEALLCALLEAYKGNPTLGATEAARTLGVHRNTIYGYTAELEGSGKLRKNGDGWEVTA